MSRKPLLWIIALLLVLVFALALNPSSERHRETIRSAVAERNPIAGALGLGALKSLVVDYHSWGIASYTMVDDHVISVGAFGLVHVRREAPPEK